MTRSSQSCLPRFATPRTPDRQTFGHRIANVAVELGQPLMPWQQLVADVGGELDEFGLPAYREIIVTVPRQSGKTTLDLAWEVERCVMWRGRQRVTYTAQTGKDAREKLLQDQRPIIEPTLLWKRFGKQIYMAAGQESFVFKDGSRIGVQSSSDDAGHGKSLDLGVIDEAFADTDDSREQSMLPAMLTKPAAQLIIVSTMGTEASVYWNRKVEQGRAAVASGSTSGIAYFEWSAHPDDDPDDPATWAGCMPALGITITEPAVRHARQTMTDGEFRRAMLNQPTIAEDRLIPAGVWLAACNAKATPAEPFSFSLEVAPDRSAAAIAVAGSNRTVELIEHRAGLSWVVDCIRGLREYGPVDLVIDEYGPASSMIDEVKASGATVVDYKTRDVEWACSGFHDALMGATIEVRESPALDAAAAAVHRKPSGDRWIYARTANADVSPLLAAVLAFDKATRGAPSEPYISW